MTYTKGKWEVEKDESGVFVGTSEQLVCKLYEVNPAQYHLDKLITAETNAALIAAAPDMLEVLEYICQLYSDNIGSMPVSFQTVVNEAEAIINKAKGVI